MKICLFTAHSPIGGGGAVILRSLVKHLPGSNITWKYISNQPTAGYEAGYMGTGFMDEGFISAITSTYKMLADQSCPQVDQLVKRLLTEDCDAYWIVSHNEGLRTALELTRVQKKRPVHLTIHDDWSGALAQRSLRYRFFSAIAAKLTLKTLKSVNSCDVISRGMKAYYESLGGKNLKVCHRYLPLDTLGLKKNHQQTHEIKIGHIGSIYDQRDMFKFLFLIRAYAKIKDLPFSLHLWGFQMKGLKIPSALKAHIHFHQDLPEEAAIQELKKCSFVYAMYPMSKGMRTFTQTSLPTKLSTYVQTGLPIFGHGPSASTLSEFLRSTGTGSLWSCGHQSEGFKVLKEVLEVPIGEERFRAARNQYFGEENLHVLKNAFLF